MDGLTLTTGADTDAGPFIRSVRILSSTCRWWSRYCWALFARMRRSEMVSRDAFSSSCLGPDKYYRWSLRWYVKQNWTTTYACELILFDLGVTLIFYDRNYVLSLYFPNLSNLNFILQIHQIWMQYGKYCNRRWTKRASLSGRTETATEKVVSQVRSRRRCGNHSSVASSPISVCQVRWWTFGAPSLTFVIVLLVTFCCICWRQKQLRATCVACSPIILAQCLFWHCDVVIFCKVKPWLDEVDIRSTNSFPAHSGYRLSTITAMRANWLKLCRKYFGLFFFWTHRSYATYEGRSKSS